MDYEANHQGLYNGICGVNPFIWNNYLLSQGIDYNSLLGGLVVYKQLLNKHKDKRATIKAYKGIQSKSNMWIIDKTIKVESNLR